jgi:hypothetical protein
MWSAMCPSTSAPTVSPNIKKKSDYPKKTLSSYKGLSSSW